MNKTDDDPDNPSVDFKSQKRRNATHQSTTDAEARLAKKANRQEAKLGYGLCAGLEVTTATDTAETEAAQTL